MLQSYKKIDILFNGQQSLSLNTCFKGYVPYTLIMNYVLLKGGDKTRWNELEEVRDKLSGLSSSKGSSCLVFYGKKFPPATSIHDCVWILLDEALSKENLKTIVQSSMERNSHQEHLSMIVCEFFSTGLGFRGQNYCLWNSKWLPLSICVNFHVW